MRTFHEPNMTKLHDTMCQALVEGNESDLDVISTVDVQIHNVMGVADTMDWDFDLKDMWLTRSRWSMMLNQYIDPDELAAWIEQVTTKIGTKNRGICVMRTKTVKARGGEATGHSNKETRRWGSCMLAISYKAKPKPQITLYSRTSYLGYIGALDLTVAWMMAKTLGEALGLEPKDFRFVWMNEAVQWHNFKSLAYLLNHPDPKRRKWYRKVMMKPEKKLKPDMVVALERHPGLRLSRKWLQKVIEEDNSGRTYGDLTYNTFRRIIRRFHTEVGGLEHAKQFEGWSHYKTGEKKGEQKEFFKAYLPLPSCHVDTLDLKTLKLNAESLAGGEYVGGDVEDDDDE